jgi:isopentenyl-diphosphate delta-isomerase
MPEPESTPIRKKEHIELCLSDEVSFKNKRNGFENYEFLHNAITEIDISKINFQTEFLKKKINYPFLISCMTGGSSESENINERLAIAANQLNIALGIGSQRQALENDLYHKTYMIIRQYAPGIPVLGNLGASQIVLMNNLKQVQFLVDLVEADAMVIHVNPLQELLQRGGQPFFKGLLKKIEKLVKALKVPVIVKEVGAGISPYAAEKLLEAGVSGIDVAGAGGTSWAGVELLRNKQNGNMEFWDWGIPTSYCIKEIYKLKKKFEFTLIGSGGINHAADLAKAFALGADIAASARIILQTLEKTEVDGVCNLITSWFDTVRKIMFLTGSESIKDLRKKKLVRKENLF